MKNYKNFRAHKVFRTALPEFFRRGNKKQFAVRFFSEHAILSFFFNF